mmetsp:Transcript_11498/g.23588  ORF Transcript_11498/g.23588 Transcript_11498/m.23588 type:complete len:99 (+) Transcript_11498:84-380(+)
MRTGTALLFFLATAAYGTDAFAPPSSAFASRAPISLAMSTKEKEDTKVAADKKEEDDDAPPVSIGWDSHQAVVRLKFCSFYGGYTSSVLILLRMHAFN